MEYLTSHTNDDVTVSVFLEASLDSPVSLSNVYQELNPTHEVNKVRGYGRGTIALRAPLNGYDQSVRLSEGKLKFESRGFDAITQTYNDIVDILSNSSCPVPALDSFNVTGMILWSETHDIAVDSTKQHGKGLLASVQTSDGEVPLSSIQGKAGMTFTEQHRTQETAQKILEEVIQEQLLVKLSTDESVSFDS